MGHRWPSVPLPLQHCRLLPSEVAEEGEPSTKRAKTPCRPTLREHLSFASDAWC